MPTIPLSRGGYEAIVDEGDFERLSKYKWQPRVGKSGHVYATRRVGQGDMRYIMMHREIMEPPSADVLIDHINGDGLDNRRANLRFATKAENNMNRAPRRDKGFKGIRLERGKWRVRVTVGGRDIHIGMYLTKPDAIAAYNEAAKVAHGEFARMNVLAEPVAAIDDIALDVLRYMLTDKKMRAIPRATVAALLSRFDALTATLAERDREIEDLKMERAEEAIRAKDE